MKALDITGEKFGRLTAIERTKKDKTGSYIWLFKCDCGNYKETRIDKVRSGTTRSCGCYHREKHRESVTTHGLSSSRFYKIWWGMYQRCNYDYIGTHNYKNYKLRGIKVKWKSFEEFRDDMHKGYLAHSNRHGESNTSIDRINNDGNYEKSNCRWATHKQQSQNNRTNCNLTFRGETKTASEWSRKLGINTSTISYRIKHMKWTTEKTLATPVRKYSKPLSLL